MKIYPSIGPRKDKSKNHTLIVLIRKNGQRKQYNTGYKIKKSHWNGKKVTNLNPDHEVINGTIKNLIDTAFQFSVENPSCTAGCILEFIKTGKISSELIRKDYGNKLIEKDKNGQEKITEQEKTTTPHNCDIDWDEAEAGENGQATLWCYEENGKLWVGNGEYSNTVNYCPFCGYKISKLIQGRPPEKKEIKEKLGNESNKNRSRKIQSMSNKVN